MSEADACPRLADVRAFWDGELRGEAVEELIRHLEQCGFCRDEHQECERFVELLAAGDAVAPLAEECREGMRAAVLEACAPQRSAWGWVAGLLRGHGRGGRRSGIARRAAWVLVPAGAVALLVWLGGSQRRTMPGSTVVQTSPGGRDRGDAPANQMPKRPDADSPPQAIDDQRPSPLPKRDLGPAIVKERKLTPGFGSRKRRTHEHVVQAPPLRKTAPAAEAHETPGRPEPPPQKIRLAQHRSPAPEPVLRERLVVLAEGSGFAAEAPAPAPRRIIAARGEDARAGQAAVIHIHVQEDRP